MACPQVLGNVFDLSLFGYNILGASFKCGLWFSAPNHAKQEPQNKKNDMERGFSILSTRRSRLAYYFRYILAREWGRFQRAAGVLKAEAYSSLPKGLVLMPGDSRSQTIRRMKRKLGNVDREDDRTSGVLRDLIDAHVEQKCSGIVAERLRLASVERVARGGHEVMQTHTSQVLARTVFENAAASCGLLRGFWEGACRSIFFGESCICFSHRRGRVHKSTR